MQPWLVRALSALVLVVSIGKLGEDFFDPPQSWQQQRQVGEPIDGFWHSAASAGCFVSENVYMFDGDRQLTSLDRVTFLDSVNVRQRIADGYVYVDKLALVDIHQPRVPVSFVYRDLGSELDLVRLTVSGKTMASTAHSANGPGGLKLCGSAGAASWLQLFFRRPFRPDEAVFYDMS